jgi:hypothetical protein
VASKIFGGDLIYVAGQVLKGGVGRSVHVYSDEACTTLAEIYTYPGNTLVSDSIVVGDSTSRTPLYYGPAAGTDTLYTRVDGTGPISTVRARTDDRLDALESGSGSAWAAADTAHAAAADPHTGYLTEVAASGTYGTPVGDHVLFVSKSGNDANDGLTVGKAFLTVAAALAAMPANGGRVQLGWGDFTEAVLTIPDKTLIQGVGREATTLRYEGVATFIPLTNKANIHFADLTIRGGAAAIGATLVALSNTFKCSFTNVVIGGQHTAASGATYRTQVGVSFLNNAGDNVFTARS